MPQTNRTVNGVLGGLLGLVGLSAVAGLLIAASVTPVLAMTGVAGNSALTIFNKLPEVLEVNAPMEQSTLYAIDGEGKEVKLASFYEQNRIPVTFDQVAPVMYEAILSSEDKNFYTHGGVSIGATVKAVIDNIKGTSSRGASTISQQYVKNVLIQECEQNVDVGLITTESREAYDAAVNKCFTDATQATGADGIERKLKEMRYAIQIEKDYSKNDILLGYLNISNFGSASYGIEAAANYYFNTTAANLTLVQAATLAGMVQNPSVYRIDAVGGTYTDKEGVAHNGEADGYQDTKDRRDYVLGRMLIDGKITQAEHDEAVATPITPTITPPVQGCASAKTEAYFCQYVKSIVLTDEAFGETPSDRQLLLRRGGLKIYTTLDYRIQGPAAQAMTDIVQPNPDNEHFGAASVSIEVGTGRILSITQNTTFLETPTEDQQYSALVFAADKEHAGSNYGFQVGSTYKLFTLIDWLEKGHSVREVLNGRSNVALKIPAACEGGTALLDASHNQNFEGSGRVSDIVEFTKYSVNSGYYAMASKLDLCDINKVADRLGVTLGDGEPVTTENVVTNVLGSKSIAPMQMANAYATVASGGTYCTPRAIDRVIGSDGQERAIPESSCTEGVISKEVAATAAYALQSVMASGGTGSAANPWDGTPLIGKTGTHETWSTMMIESSTKVTTAVWAGRWDGQTNIYQKWVNGYRLNEVRYPLAKAAQAAANATYPGDAFPEPDPNLTKRILTQVPNVVGKTVDEARAILEDVGFSLAEGTPVDSDQPTNIIVQQDLSGQAPGGSTITVSLSNGQGSKVPDVTGDSATEAGAALLSAGFSDVSFAKKCADPDAEVSSTEPAAGTSANKSQTIKVKCN